MLAAFVGMNVAVIGGQGGYRIPAPAFYVAISCGTIALFALWSFQEGLKRGKIATSWLIINLSSVIPTLGSIVIYHEPVNLKKLLIIGLIFVAIVLIWKDGLEDLRKLEQHPGAELTSPSSARTGDIPMERQI
jgi:drug/metabolite transporter (DMT)-like permease